MGQSTRLTLEWLGMDLVTRIDHDSLMRYIAILEKKTTGHESMTMKPQRGEIIGLL